MLGSERLRYTDHRNQLRWSLNRLLGFFLSTKFEWIEIHANRTLTACSLIESLRTNMSDASLVYLKGFLVSIGSAIETNG